MNRALKLSLALLAILAMGGLATIRGLAAADTSLTGVLGITWGDSAQGGGLPPRVDLYDTQGNDYLLQVDPAVAAAAGGLLALNGVQVTVQGTFDTTALDQSGNPTFVVSDIASTGQASALSTVTGSHPWVIIMCKFPDYSAEPRNQAYFQGLFGSTFPGINDFWQRNSYGLVNLNGTTVMPAWVVLPHPRSYYIGSSANLQALTNDCTGTVDATVNFAQFSGVSMMFNAELDGMAWGGTTYLSRDGVSIIRATWMPPWGYGNQSVLAHEVGHGFGLPHSSGPYNQTYDSPWDVMSAWPTCTVYKNPTYGCVGVQTISFHRELLGWIPSGKIYSAGQGSNGQITLERLGQPTNPAGSYLMAIIPLPGSTTRFYTVEARRYGDDYEKELIGEAVVIHLVDTTRGDRLAQVVDGDNNGNVKDAGSMWTPGETYADSANDIYISVLSATTTGFVVNIRDGTTANDAFTTPTAISSFPYTNSINTPTATVDPSDPVFPCASTTGQTTVWYKFTPGAPGPVQVSTVGSNYDTLLAIWTGSAGSLTNVACDDESGGNGTSATSADLTAGKTYYIEVAGKTGGGSLNFSLGFTPCFALTTTVSPAAWGSVAVSPAPNCYGTYYKNGTSVQLSATAASAKAFSAWSGSFYGSSNPATFAVSKTSTITANFTPATPGLVSPADGSMVDSLRPTLDWSDVSGATYQVQLSKFSNLSSPLTYNTSASTVIPSVDLTLNTQYYWRVRALQSKIYSAWSAVGKFTTPNPPSVPVLVAPGNGKSVPSLKPNLDWNDSGNGPSGYQVQISYESAFAAPVIDAQSAGSSYAIGNSLTPNTRYYWHVRAFNALNQYSRWSATYSFGTLPAAPSLVSPLGGIGVDSLRPKFDWDVPAGGAKSYTIQIARDAGFTLQVKSVTVSATEFSMTADLPRDSLVYWRVLSNGTFGKSAWSATETLHSPNPPTKPSLLQPGNSAVISTYRPTFDWSDSLPQPFGVLPIPYTDSSGYEIQISSTSSFSASLIDASIPNSTYTPGADLPIGTYFWRVRSFNALSQYSNWSSTFRFFTPGGVSGTVLDASTAAPISGATIGIVGTNLSTTTDSSGVYTLRGVPSGTRSLQINSSGHVTLTTSLAIGNGALAHFSAAMVSSGAASGEYRMVLFWESGPVDLDLHLWLPGSTPSHVRWDSLGSAANFPNASLIDDSRLPYGVETTKIDQLYPGTYMLGVYNYSNEAAIGQARAVVWVYKGDSLIKIIRAPGSGIYRWWRVVTLSGTGSITVSSSLVSSAPGPYDKSGGTGPK